MLYNAGEKDLQDKMSKVKVPTQYTIDRYLFYLYQAT